MKASLFFIFMTALVLIGFKIGATQEEVSKDVHYSQPFGMDVLDDRI